MPRYGYRCDICGTEDTIMHDRNEDLSGCDCVKNLDPTIPEELLPACRGHMKKLLSSAPFKFVGPHDKTQVIHHD